MEVLRKRRASTEVQELMNAVKNDYEFFARFDSSFQSAPTAKRQRTLSDNVLVQFAVVRPKPRYNQGVNLSGPNEYSSSSIPELIQIPLEDRYRGRILSPEQTRDEIHELCGKSRRQQTKSREQEALSRDKHRPSRELWDYSREYNEKSCQEEQMFQKSTPDFWASHHEGALLTGKRHRNPFTYSTTRISSQPNHQSWPEKPAPEGFICLSSQPIIFRHADDERIAWRQKMGQKLSPYKVNYLPLESADEKRVLEDVPPLLIGTDTNTNRGFSEECEDETRRHMIFSRSTRRNVSGFPTSEPHDASPSKIRRANIEIELETTEKPTSLEKTSASVKELITDTDSEDDLVIVESTPSSPAPHHNLNPTNQKPDDAQDNHVTSSQTNETPERESKEVLPIESPEGDSPSSLSDELWPDYVITRVGSLLWLDKDVVYPITLDEMRRRIQAPENFSFQMLIAYVRHSRAKGRQFLEYWKCRPTGKTSRPNVLSKLCEADAKELVKGIRQVNEEYFPRKTLARNVVANIFQKKGNELTENEAKEESQDLFVQKKVKAIQKSRSVFKILQTTLQNSQDDKRFATFNVASHNAGLDNIKNSLNFLDSIFERMESHVQENQKALQALTA